MIRNILSFGKNIGILLLALLVLSSAGSAAEYVYVANSDDGTFSVIDVTKDEVLNTFQAGVWTFGVAFSPDKTKMYATDWLDNSVSVIDLSTMKVISTISVDINPCGITVSPDGQKIYVANWLNSVSVIDASTNTVVKTIDGLDGPMGVVITSDGAKAYATNYGSNSVSVINTATNTVISNIGVGIAPSRIAINHDGTKVYAINEGEYGKDGSVSVIDTSTDSVIATINVGQCPEGAAITPDDARLYVANTISDSVSVVDLSANTLIQNIDVGDNPCSVAVSLDGTKIYVANIYSNSISVIDVVSNSVMKGVEVGHGPTTVAVTQAPEVVPPDPEPTNTAPTVESLIVTDTDTAIPTISWTYKDKENALQEFYEAEVWTGAGGTGTKMWSTSRNSMYSSVTYMGDSLGRDKEYYVRVKVSDGFLWSDWSETSFSLNFAFSPNIHGYRFANPLGSEYSWESFCRTYGYSGVQNTIVYLDDNWPYQIPTWEYKFYELYYKTQGLAGNCFGMSASSVLLYNNGLNIWPYYQADALPASWKNTRPDYTLSTVDEWVKYNQPLLFDKACLDEMTKYGNLSGKYNELKTRLASKDVMVMGFNYGPDNVEKPPGHAVVPYRIIESQDHKIGHIYIYDPNHPYNPDNSLDYIKYIDVDLENWHIEDYDEATNIRNSVRLFSFEAIKADPELPDNIYGIDNSGSANLLFVDSSGRMTGYDSGTYKEEIPGVCSLPSYNGQEDSDGSVGYYVQDQTIDMELHGKTNGISAVSIFAPNGMILADVAVTPGSIDTFDLLGEGKGIEFKSGSGTSSLDLLIENSEQIVYADFSRIGAGDYIDLSNNNGIIDIRNRGESKICNLYLEKVGENTGSDDGIKNIVIEKDSTVHIKPSDWKEISTTEIIVEHDIGSDGIVDFIQTFRSNEPELIFPVADFTANVTEGRHPLDVQFTSTSADATGYQWNFGDGSENVTIADPVHTFTSVGTFDVVLTASNENGTRSKNMSINVTKSAAELKDKKPVADFRADVHKGIAPLTVRFTDSSEHGPSSWSWDFGDGSETSVEQNPVHVYTNPGEYTVNLTVGNEVGTDYKRINQFINVEDKK